MGSSCVFTSTYLPHSSLLQSAHLVVHSLLSCVQLFGDPMGCSLPGYSWDFPGKNIGVGCHFFLQRIFLTQGLNPHLLLGRWILYQWATKTLPFASMSGPFPPPWLHLPALPHMLISPSPLAQGFFQFSTQSFLGFSDFALIIPFNSSTLPLMPGKLLCML